MGKFPDIMSPPHWVLLVFRPIVDVGFDIQMNAVVVIVISNNVFVRARHVVPLLQEARHAAESSSHRACNDILYAPMMAPTEPPLGPFGWVGSPQRAAIISPPRLLDASISALRKLYRRNFCYILGGRGLAFARKLPDDWEQLK